MPRTAQATTKTKRGNDARAQAWRSMRMLKVFSLSDLQVTGVIRYDNARRYVQRLEACGVIRLAVAHVSGRAGSVKRWRLVKDLGPKAPITRGDGGLYDPNHRRAINAMEEANDGAERKQLASGAR